MPVAIDNSWKRCATTSSWCRRHARAHLLRAAHRAPGWRGRRRPRPRPRRDRAPSRCAGARLECDSPRGTQRNTGWDVYSKRGSTRCSRAGTAWAKAFTRIGKEIVIAVKAGGPDPTHQPRSFRRVIRECCVPSTTSARRGRIFENRRSSAPPGRDAAADTRRSCTKATLRARHRGGVVEARHRQPPPAPSPTCAAGSNCGGAGTLAGTNGGGVVPLRAHGRLPRQTAGTAAPVTTSSSGSSTTASRKWARAPARRARLFQYSPSSRAPS